MAYGASVDVEEEYGLVTFSIYRSPDAFKAFEAAGKVLKGLADGSVCIWPAVRHTFGGFTDRFMILRPNWMPILSMPRRAPCLTPMLGEKPMLAPLYV